MTEMQRGRRPHEDEYRDWSDAAQAKECLESPEDGRGTEFSPRVFRGRWPCQYLGFRLLIPEL